MTIEEIQQEVATELGYGSWYAVQHSLRAFNSKKWLDTMYKKVANRYAFKIAIKVRQDCESNAFSALDNYQVTNKVSVYVCKAIMETEIPTDLQTNLT